jgi:SAM-dependent methyltransferase
VIVDVGTADALMLDELRRRLGPRVYVGVDRSLELLKATQSATWKVQGDALHLPIRPGSADAVVATAVIEHVEDGGQMLWNCARALRPGGLLVLTTPDPIMEQVATALGLLKDAGHQRTFRLGELRRMAEASGFAVVEARKFMFSPVGFPGERGIERVFRRLGLDFVMANQLLVASRRHDA